MYLSLIKQGWTLPQIDDMDVHYFFELMDYQEEDQAVYIDQIL